jgi:hypothetical protein
VIGRVRIGVVAAAYVLYATLAVGLAWPAARLIGLATLFHPRGDSVLFEDGAVYLIEVLRLYRSQLASVLEGTSFLVLLVAYAGLFPLSMMLHALSARGSPSLSSLAGAAGRSLGALSLLLGLSLAATAIALGVPMSIGALLETKLDRALGARNADLAALGIRVCAFALVALVAILHDLARAAVVIRPSHAVDAVGTAVASLRAHAGRALIAFSLRWLVVLTLIAAGALATARLGVATDLRFLLVVGLHQLIIFTLILLRAVWLRFAITLVANGPNAAARLAVER